MDQPPLTPPQHGGATTTVAAAAFEDPLSPSTRFTSSTDLAFEIDSLYDLASRGQWRSVLDKVSRARSLSLLPHPHDHLVYLSFSALALLKLRRFSESNRELENLVTSFNLSSSIDPFDDSKLRYEAYPEIYPNRSGSMLPFSVRYLYAVVPLRLGDRNTALDRLYNLLDFVRSKIDSDKDQGQWIRREAFVMSAIVNAHFSNREFDICLSLLVDLISGNPDDPFLISKLGFVQLQIGDIAGAKQSFAHVEKIVSGSEKKAELENLVARNKALECLVSKDLLGAVRLYEECIERDSGDVVAINNKALCLMYSRDLSDSIKVIEGALERVPTLALNETLVVNLCSMYELAYVNHGDVKKSLSNWIARVAPDDFDTSCTRI